MAVFPEGKERSFDVSLGRGLFDCHDNFVPRTFCDNFWQLPASVETNTAEDTHFTVNRQRISATSGTTACTHKDTSMPKRANTSETHISSWRLNKG